MKSAIALCSVLALVLFVMFHPLFSSGKWQFSNDCPLGVAESQHSRDSGDDPFHWNDLNWVGSHEPDGIVSASWIYFDVGRHPLVYFAVFTLSFLFWRASRRAPGVARQAYLAFLSCLMFSTVAVAVRLYLSRL